jgi:hypothetical protein
VIGFTAALKADITEDEKLVNLKAFSYLVRSLSQEELELVQDANTPADIWSFLRQVHAIRSQKNLLLLLQELINGKYEINSTIISHVARVRGLVGRIH